MSVTDYFQIGNLSVPSSWIAFIVAAIFAYGAVRARFGKRHAEVMADAFFIVVIVWKLSVLLTDFGSVLRSPLAVIYFDGGAVGFYLGLLVAAGKIVVDRRKGRLVAVSVQVSFYRDGHCTSCFSNNDGCIERRGMACARCDTSILWGVHIVFLAG